MAGNQILEKSWLKEVPVDPWDHPFRVVVMGDRHEHYQQSSSGYPDQPPVGTAVLVISAGPNGLYDTDLAKLGNTDGGNSLQSDNVIGGDDLGFVLSSSSAGGDR